jgi:hypothetical protein
MPAEERILGEGVERFGTLTQVLELTCALIQRPDPIGERCASPEAMMWWLGGTGGKTVPRGRWREMIKEGLDDADVHAPR